MELIKESSKPRKGQLLFIWTYKDVPSKSLNI